MNSHIRNFAIIAHIDHGKSTLADRLLEATGTIAKREMQEQILDSNPIERERGITIKLAPVRMIYKIPNSKYQISNKFQNPNSKQNNLEFDAWNLKIADSKQEFILNLIDTPGHVDFNYEVSRSLQAGEGALLVVDATQGVQAQTLANLNLARNLNLTVIPIINKIDLPNAQINQTISQIIEIGFKKEEIMQISAKKGINIDQVLRAIITRIPPPHGEVSKPLRALVFSSQYDPHKGVVCYVRVVDGEINQLSAVRRQSSVISRLMTDDRRQMTENVGLMRLHFMASNTDVEPIEIGYFIPYMQESKQLLNGEVGYIATGLKDVSLARVGDTITLIQNAKIKSQNDNEKLKVEDNSIINNPKSVIHALPGYKEPKPMVFLGLYPINSNEYPQVREALGKLRLSDSAFTYKPISSLALGNGFHCGFLGLLHAEVVQERLAREFNLALLATAPSVEYRIKIKNQKSKIKNEDVIARSQKDDEAILFNNRTIEQSNNNLLSIQSATEYPDPSQIDQTLEPVMQVTIFSPKKYVGNIMQLCQEKRGEYIDLTYVSEQAKFTYLIPLSEMIVDFFDQLKSSTAGYASMTYDFFDYQPVKVVKMDILLNHEKVDAFSQLVVESRAQYLGKNMVEKLSKVIPRHQFNVPIQATIGGQIIAREDVKPFRKDVLQKLYGGDRTRKDKLLEAQKKGKKKMKMIGNVEIPQTAFIQVFKR